MRMEANQLANMIIVVAIAHMNGRVLIVKTKQNVQQRIKPVKMEGLFPASGPIANVTVRRDTKANFAKY